MVATYNIENSMMGKRDALLTIHGRRLGISPPDGDSNCAILLDGFNVGGLSGVQLNSGNQVTPLAGGGQSSLSSITIFQEVTVVTGTGTTSDSLMLPPTAGAFPPSGGCALSLTVVNASSLAIAIFPSSGDAINTLASNVSWAIPASGSSTGPASSGTVNFFCVSSGNWYTK